MRAAAVALFVVAMTMPYNSHAQQTWERTEGRWSWFLPELKISAKTSGEAEFSLRGSFAWGAFEDADLLFWPVGKIQTDDGVVTLIGIDDDGIDEPLPWRLGGALGLTYFGNSEPVRADIVHAAYRDADRACRKLCPSPRKGYCKAVRDAVLESLKRDAKDVPIVQYCTMGRVTYNRDIKKKTSALLKIGAAACGIDPTGVTPSDLCPAGKRLFDTGLSDFRKKIFNACWDGCDGIEKSGFCAVAREEELHKHLDASDLCDEGREVYKKRLKRRRDDDARLPPFSLSMGGIAGRDGFAYYAEDADDASMLTEQKEQRTSFKVGFVATHVFSRWATLEYAAFYEQTADAASAKVKWCTPKGNIPREDIEYDPLDDATFDVANKCSEAKFGAPTTTHEITVRVEYGLTGDRGEGWRAALGPQLTLAKKGDDSFNISRLAFGLPFYVDLFALPKEYGAYRGVLRTTPAIEAYRDDAGELARRFVLTLDVLAQRTLFGGVADAL